MIYTLDTNAVSDFLIQRPTVVDRAWKRWIQGDILTITQPIYYEVLRGLLWRKASVKLQAFRQDVLPLFRPLPLIDADWEQAAQFWAEARRKGKQLGDPDLLLAASVARHAAVIVSSDADFDALPIQRKDWRI